MSDKRIYFGYSTVCNMLLYHVIMVLVCPSRGTAHHVLMEYITLVLFHTLPKHGLPTLSTLFPGAGTTM